MPYVNISDNDASDVGSGGPALDAEKSLSIQSVKRRRLTSSRSPSQTPPVIGNVDYAKEDDQKVAEEGGGILIHRK